MTQIIRVLVIDDSSFNRRTIGGILSECGDVEVVATAADGEQGLKEAARVKPDLITLDIEMPRMDGFTFLRLLMSQMPTPVLVISSHSRKQEIFQALELGALDFIAKPSRFVSEDTAELREQIHEKLEVVRALQVVSFRDRGRSDVVRADAPAPAVVAGPEQAARRLVCLGASTGGPPALQSLFSSLPVGGHTAFLVAQHMPEKFTRAFAERLNRLSGITIAEARDDEPVLGGRGYIAPGGSHLQIRSTPEGLRTALVEGDDGDVYIPSVDRLFVSVAEVTQTSTLGVVLTGMGVDGAEGVRALAARGARLLAESEETAVVYGMPKEAVKTGCVEEVLPLPELIAIIQAFAGREK